MFKVTDGVVSIGPKRAKQWSIEESTHPMVKVHASAQQLGEREQTKRLKI